MSFKEKREFEQLEKDIAALEDEKKQIEEALCSGTISVDQITEMSKRLPVLNDELDEKSMRWLELSEIEMKVGKMIQQYPSRLLGNGRAGVCQTAGHRTQDRPAAGALYAAQDTRTWSVSPRL